MPAPIKQPININFQQGLDLKTDPYQVVVGKFESLVNSVFDKVGRLTKRNGFPGLTPLPAGNAAYLTTLQDNLEALGTNLYSYSSPQSTWIEKGSTYPLTLSTLPLIRNSLNQSQVDTAIASNGLVCIVYSEQDSSGTVYKYSIATSSTGENIVEPAPIPVSSGTVTNAPRVFTLGNYFIVIFQNVITGTSHLEYIVLSSITGQVVQANNQISASFTNSSTLAYDAALCNGNLYIAWNGASSSGIQMAFLSAGLVLSSAIPIDAAHTATMVSVTADSTLSSPLVWVTYYDSANSTVYTAAVDTSLNVHLDVTVAVTSSAVLNVTSAAQNGVNTIFYEIANNYGYDSSIPTHYVSTNTVTSGGVVGTPFISARSIGLASKAFIVDSIVYYLAAYQSPYQPTYFLMNGSTSTEANPIVVAKFAYSNGGGYLITGLPNAYVVNSDQVYIPYLYKDLIQAVNKNTNVPTGSQVAGVYSQTGINLALITFDKSGLTAVEMGNNLQISGGFIWGYDGYLPVEQNFFLWPDSVEATWSTTGGSIAAQPDGSTNTKAYFYQVVYQWTDNQGNPYTSAPSIPISVTTTGSGTTGSITINVPTLRLTYKIQSPVKISIYRWSVAQQSYYQVTSLSFTGANPLTLNNTTVDYITFTDTLSDSSILGNNLIYTTGGVVEDISPPSSSIFALFDDRMWLVDAEDTNLLWYSKQVIEGTPVEMSDLFTFYVAPSTGSQGSTGPITALFPMDDKLVIFKENAIYFINGTGPDNTGANSQYSQPIFVTSSVGCTNTRSIAMTQAGLMFQSNKGIWLLGRDLSTTYIGAPVEAYNSATVTSALTVPETNQVRFGLDSGKTLMYDYFVQQWGTFEGIPSISSTIYNELHTLVNQYGQVSQESAGTYYDLSDPVLMSFTTSWLQVAGLRGYQRAYWFYLLGTYLSPHKLSLGIAYDYNASPVQGTLIAPINYAPPYGSDPYYGGDGSTAYGGPNSIEQWRVFLQQQRCKAFQISMQEVFDPTYGTIAGPGLTLSGLNIIVGVKKAYAPIPSNQQAG